jgi:hypothetical protein
MIAEHEREGTMARSREADAIPHPGFTFPEPPRSIFDDVDV